MSNKRLEFYKWDAAQYWNKEYKTIDWKAVHDAGGREKTVALAAREIDLFLFPTEEKIEGLITDTENNPFPTFSRDYVNHRPLTDYISDLETATVLDYGCGSLARYSIEFSKRFKRVYGIDISSEAIKLARSEVIKKERKNVVLMQNNGVNLPLPSNYIDFIFSNLVLQHIGNIEVNYAIAEEFLRVLKPGGVMRIEYLDGSARKDDLFAHPAEGSGITRDDLQKMYGDRIVSVSEETPWLWVTILKEE